jgi:hypothetical protein
VRLPAYVEIENHFVYAILLDPLQGLNESICWPNERSATCLPTPAGWGWGIRVWGGAGGGATGKVAFHVLVLTSSYIIVGNETINGPCQTILLLSLGRVASLDTLEGRLHAFLRLWIINETFYL